jgi:ABC-type nitrate/sulfonate/bicarbonate transport system substrate-binding protein
MYKDFYQIKRRKAMSLERRRFLKAVAAGTAASALPTRLYAQTARKVSFMQAWLPDGSNMFIYAAKNKGFYKKRGIDLELSRGYGSVAASQAVGAGKFDFGMAAVAAGVQQSAKGIDLVHMGTVHYDSTMGIAVLADSPVKTPKDLEGRKLGSTVTSGEYPFLPLFARNAGLDLSKVQRVQLDAQVRNRALLSKEVDAISAFAGSSIPSLAAQGVDTRFIPYSRHGVPLYGLALITQPKRLAQDPGVCQAVVEASLEGLAFALNNPDEALEAFGNELKEMAMTKTGMEQIRIGFGMYALTTLKPPARNGLGWQEPEAIKQQTDLVMEYVADKSDTRPALDGIYTNRFIGGVKLTDAQWAAAEKRFAKYAELVG